MTAHKLEVILVNLISYDFLVRYQAPLPVNTLAGYLKTDVPDIKVTVIDMQEIFDKNGNIDSNKEVSFNETVSCTIRKI